MKNLQMFQGIDKKNPKDYQQKKLPSQCLREKTKKLVKYVKRIKNSNYRVKNI